MVVKRGQTSQYRGKFKEKNSLKHAFTHTAHMPCPYKICLDICNKVLYLQ